MTTNERIARQLGWKRWKEANPQIDWASMPDYSAGWGWASPEGKRETFVPDYEHSLDALLEPLGVLRERGWIVNLAGNSKNWMGVVSTVGKDYFHEADSPSEALALAVAEALEQA